MTDLIISFLSSVVVSGLLTTFLIFLAKTWIGERIKKSIEHEYQVALERLRTDNAQYQSVQATAISSMSAVRQAAVERRLQSIERIWSAIIKLKASGLPSIMFADVLVADEYRDIFTNPMLTNAFDEVSLQKLIEENEAFGNVEECRLYVGEELYRYFFVYRAVIGRLFFLFEQGRKRGEVAPWYSDSGIQQILRSAATQEEVAAFATLKTGQLSWVLSLVETKLLQRANLIISGHESADFSLEQARRIAELAHDKNSM